MSKLRIRFIQVIGVLIIGGSLIACFWRLEWFPYSNYPMYARIYIPQEFVYMDIVEVNAQGEEFELPIRHLFYPFGRQPLIDTLSKNIRAGKDPQDLAQGLYNFYLFKKERRRLKYDFKGLRIYRTYYDWNEFVEFKLRKTQGSPQNPQPKRRELIAEYVQK